MSINQLKTRARRPHRLALAVAVAALASAAWVSPALAGGGNGDGTGIPVNTAPPQVVGLTQLINGILVSEYTTFGSWTNIDTATWFRIEWFDCDSSGAHCAQISTTDEKAPPYGSTDYYPFLDIGTRDVGHTIRSAVTALNSAGPSMPAWSAPTAVIRAA